MGLPVLVAVLAAARQLRDADWIEFRREQSAGGQIVAHTKPSTTDGVTFVRVQATDVQVPVGSMTSVFLSEELSKKWNPYIGTVLHLGQGVQLQMYTLPWPFVAREYLSHCTDEKLPDEGHQAQCRPVDSHPSAPERKDRVRGKSEALWRFTPSKKEPRRRTDIYFEGAVDPGGSLPKWLVNELGKHATVNIVGSLIKLASQRA